MRRSFSFCLIGLLSSSVAAPAAAQTPNAPPGDPPPVATATPVTAPTSTEPAAAPGRRRRAGDDDDEEEQRKAHNAIFLELGGNGLVYSVNYERLFGDSNFSMRAGLSYISLGASSNTSGASANVSLFTLPVLGNYYVGSANHKLQLGAGLTFMNVSGTSSSGDGSFVKLNGFAPAPTIVIGYRYIPARGGFAFGIGFTPFIIPGGDKVLFPWGGLSFGGIF